LPREKGEEIPVAKKKIGSAHEQYNRAASKIGKGEREREGGRDEKAAIVQIFVV